MLQTFLKYFIAEQSSYYMMAAKAKGSKGRVKKKSVVGKKPL
jgi:hypothetical protein